MSAYLAGVLVGRLIASYLIVLLLFFLFAKFKANVAFVRSTKWYGLVSTLVVFALGVSVGVAQSTL